MKRWVLSKTIRTAVILAPLIGGCVGVPEERGREFYLDRINRASSIEVMLNTVTKVTEGEELATYEKEGSGFVVGNYVFSRDHITSRYYISTTQISPFSPPREVKVPLDRDTVINEETFLDEKVLYSVYESDEDDVAIFDLSKQPELCEKYCNNRTLGDLMTEDELYQGMRVYWLGQVSGFYKESHITNLRDEEGKGTKYEDTFLTQERSIGGTSGKPLWHKDKIIGIASYLWKGMGGFGFMDNYIEVIEEYEENE